MPRLRCGAAHQAFRCGVGSSQSPEHAEADRIIDAAIKIVEAPVRFGHIIGGSGRVRGAIVAIPAAIPAVIAILIAALHGGMTRHRQRYDDIDLMALALFGDAPTTRALFGDGATDREAHAGIGIADDALALDQVEQILTGGGQIARLAQLRAC
jgi:hypothetical protein